MKNILKFTALWTIMVLLSCGGKQSPKSNNTQSTGDSMVDQLTKQIEADADNPELLYQRATALYEKEEYEASITDLEAAMRMDSLQPKYYHLLADSYLDYYQSRKALDMMERASRLFPERIPTLLKLAEMQLILTQNENSIFTVNEILRLDPQNNDAYFLLGMNFRAMGELDRAINSFQTAVENDPEMVDAWLILGELHERNGTGSPIQYYENALLVDPTNPQVMHSKAFYLQNNGDIPGALSVYREINEKKPQYTDAYLNAGILYMEMDSFELAFEQMNILIGVAPENPGGYYYRGMIHKAYGNYDAAQIDLQNAVNLSKNSAEAEQELEEVTRLLAENPTQG